MTQPILIMFAQNPLRNSTKPNAHTNIGFMHNESIVSCSKRLNGRHYTMLPIIRPDWPLVKRNTMSGSALKAITTSTCQEHDTSQHTTTSHPALKPLWQVLKHNFLLLETVNIINGQQSPISSKPYSPWCWNMTIWARAPKVLVAEHSLFNIVLHHKKTAYTEYNILLKIVYPGFLQAQ